jgi:LacI family transcriptional regulator
MREVAQRAGVSKAAVSYVLNGRETSMRIPEGTRDRILTAVRDLGYRPNGLARSLARKRTRTIAIVMQYPALFSGWSGFTNELMHGVTNAAIEQGFDVMLHTRNPVGRWAHGEGGLVEAELTNLTDGRVDGALLLRDLDDPLTIALCKQGFPTVLMFTHSSDPEQWFIDCDNVAGARIATEHLISQGHTRIAHFAGSHVSGAGRERREGYRQALDAAGLPVRPEWIVGVTDPDAVAAPASLLLQLPRSERPTAVFAWSDDVAIQTMRSARALGLSVPRDLAVVGFDSTALCDHTDPPLTSVRQPIFPMAADALRLLIQRIHGEKPAQTQVRVAPTLVVRRSCHIC